jgi:hypothetical protein
VIIRPDTKANRALIEQSERCFGDAFQCATHAHVDGLHTFGVTLNKSVFLSASHISMRGARASLMATLRSLRPSRSRPKLAANDNVYGGSK